MRLDGRIWKHGKHWLVEVPTLDAMTQGRSRAEAIRMVGDLIATMVGKRGFSVTVRPSPAGAIGIETSDDTALAPIASPRLTRIVSNVPGG